MFNKNKKLQIEFWKLRDELDNIRRKEETKERQAKLAEEKRIQDENETKRLDKIAELKKVAPLGTKFNYLGFDMVVVDYETMYERETWRGYINTLKQCFVCEYRNAEGHIDTKTFTSNQTDLIKKLK